MYIVKYKYQDIYIVRSQGKVLFSLTTEKEKATRYKNYKYISEKLRKNDLDLMFNVEEEEK